MAKLKSVRTFTHKGEEGFVMTWGVPSLSKSGAEFRAVMSTAMRFPTTITEAKAIQFNDMDDGHEVGVFVPTEGFLSAGIRNPVDFLQEQLDKVDLDL